MCCTITDLRQANRTACWGSEKQPQLPRAGNANAAYILSPSKSRVTTGMHVDCHNTQTRTEKLVRKTLFFTKPSLNFRFLKIGCAIYDTDQIEVHISIVIFEFLRRHSLNKM